MITSRRLLGVRIDNVDMNQSTDLIGQWIGQGKCRQVATVGTEFIMKARRNLDFKQALEQADLALADGVGPVWFSGLTGPKLKQRVAGVDLSYRLAELAAKHDWRLFLLGAAEGVAEQAADTLMNRFVGLKIAGSYAGSPADEQAADIIKRTNDSKADIVLVAYGAPAQDLWIAKHRADLNASVAIGVGGTFDFMAGHIHRAPKLFQRLGLEWLWRLIRQPWRLKRMLAIPLFMVLMLKEAIFNRRRVDA